MRKNYSVIRKSKHSIWQSGAISLSVAFLLFIGLTIKAETVLASPGTENYALGKVLEVQAEAPDANAGPDKILSCANTTVKLEGSSTTAGATFSWEALWGNIVSGANTATPVVDAVGDYRLTVTVNGTTASDVVFVREEKVALGEPGSIYELRCSSPTLTLRSTTTIVEGAYSWTGPNGFTSSEKNVTVSAGGGGTYDLTVTNLETGCQVSASAYVLDHTGRADANAGPDKVLTCESTTVTLEGSTTQGQHGDGITQFAWMPTGGGHILSGANTPNPEVSAPGTYILTVTNHYFGCSASDTVVVTQETQKPHAAIEVIGPHRLNCNWTSTRLVGRSTIDNPIFNWTGPNGFTSTADKLVVSVGEGGLYTLTVTDPTTGCKGSYSYYVADASMPPGANAGPDKVLTCNHPSVTLEGSTNDDWIQIIYSWFDSEGNRLPPGEVRGQTTVTKPGTYILEVRNNQSGCTSTDTVVVTQEGELPNVSVSVETVNCNTVQLTGTTTVADAAFSWTGPHGFTSSEPVVRVQIAGNYKLTVTNKATGCSASAVTGVTPSTSATAPVCYVSDFNLQEKGLIDRVHSWAGHVPVMGRKRNPDGSYASGNYAAIFDTQTPTGDDTDLYTTNWGGALIINQDLSNEPNDNQWGGELILDYSAIGPVMMESLKALDIDSYEGMSWVYLYDGDGNELYKVQLQNLGDNSKQNVDLGNTKGVMKMKIVLDGRNEMGHFAGSGAIDDIKFCRGGSPGLPCEDEAEETMAAGISNATAYPNPFQGKGNIEFRLQESEKYVVNLYDMQGNLVRELKAGQAKAGEKISVEVDGSNLYEGMYIARIMSDSGAKTIKLILRK